MSRLEDDVRTAAEMLARLEEMESLESRKLSAKAFMRDALNKAKTKPIRLEELERALGPGTADAEAFIRRVSHELRRPNWTALPNDLTMFTRVYGSADAEQQLTAAGFSVGEAVAVAVQRATREAPEAFGTVDLPKKSDGEVKAVRRDYEALVFRLTFSPVDLTVGEDAVTFRFTGDAVRLAPNWRDELVRWAGGNPIKKAA